MSMKRLLLSLFLVLPLFGFAQKGMQGIGVNYGGGSCYDGDCLLGEFSLKYQNHITNNIRISPHLKYYYMEDYNDDEYYGWYFGCDFHFFFTQVKRFRTYGIVGLSFGSTNTEDYYNEYTDDFFGACIEAGIGIDYRIGYHFSLQGEFLPFSGYLDQGDLLCSCRVGLTYTF